MTLLLTSDLHGNRHWYEWLIHSAKRVDAICIAGDLTEPMAGNGQWQRVMAELSAWKLGSSRVQLFASEGDRDLWGSRWFWLKTLAGTRRFGRLTVTSLPWKARDPLWFQNPARWRQDPWDCWLVLQHEPPPGMAVSCGAVSGLLEDSPALQFEPDFLLSGHMGTAPWEPQGSWWDRIGRTYVFNAGFDPEAKIPCHILLDIEKREAIWRHARGYERIRLDSCRTPFNSKSTTKTL